MGIPTGNRNHELALQLIISTGSDKLPKWARQCETHGAQNVAMVLLCTVGLW